MKILAAIAFLFLFCGNCLADGFANVKCGADIAKALIGQRMSNEPVVTIENRHRALDLKDLGADEISDNLSSVSWLICGHEFMLLIDRKDLVRDVLPFPAHSKTSPAFSGMCQIAGRDNKDIIVAVLNNQAGTDPLTAQAAWKIDQRNARFVKISTDALLCPRNGIITTDGGM
jgi:hypothetical protein